MTSFVAEPRHRLAVLLAVAVGARAITFGNPIVHVDEEFYLAAARAMCGGALPYVDIWDRKPIGLFLLYLPAGCAPLPLGVWVYQATALAAATATAWLVAQIADRAGWQAGATPAAALYLLWLSFADGQGGQAPVFYNALVAGAALLVMTHTRRRHGIAAMLLVGVAMQIKYSAVFEGVFFGLWLVWAAWRAIGPWRALVEGAVLAVAALVPTAAAVMAYAALRQLPAYAYANFVSILQRSPDPLREQLNNLMTTAAILLPMLGMGLAGLVGRGDAGSPERRFVRGWTLAAIGGFVVFGSWFNHYALPVLVPLAVCIAGSISVQRWRPRHVTALLALVFAVAQGVLLSQRWVRGTPAEFRHIAAAVGRGPGTLFVYSGSSLYYSFSGRPVPTRYLFPSHLQTARENGAVGISQRDETARILAARPAVVVVQSLDGGERTDLHAAVVAWLPAHGYRLASRWPLGNKHVDVWKLPAV